MPLVETNGTPGPIRIQTAIELSKLAKAINAEHQAGEEATRRGLRHYRAAGELLIKARDECKRSGRKWIPWLRAHVKFSQARAYHYLRLAEFLVTRNPTPEETEDEWRRISGNAPPPPPEPLPEKEESPSPPKPAEHRRSAPPLKRYPIDLTPKKHAQFTELVRLLMKLRNVENSAEVIYDAVDFRVQSLQKKDGAR
jgi:hypothetical protein